MPKKKYEIFMSFKDKDKNQNRTESSRLAEDIFTTLTTRGYRVFFSREALPGIVGGEFKPMINAALKSARLLVLVFSNAEEVNSEWVKHEWMTFSTNRKPILTVYKGCGDADWENVPYIIRKLQYCDLTDGSERQYEKMLERVDDLLRKRSLFKSKETKPPKRKPIPTKTPVTVPSGQEQKKPEKKKPKKEPKKISPFWPCAFVVLTTVPLLVMSILIRIVGKNADYAERFRSVKAVGFFLSLHNAQTHLLFSVALMAIPLVIASFLMLITRMKQREFWIMAVGMLIAQCVCILVFSWIKPPLNIILEQCLLVFSVSSAFALYEGMDSPTLKEWTESTTHESTGSYILDGCLAMAIFGGIPSFLLLLPEWWGINLSLTWLWITLVSLTYEEYKKMLRKRY